MYISPEFEITNTGPVRIVLHGSPILGRDGKFGRQKPFVSPTRDGIGPEPTSEELTDFAPTIPNPEPGN